ncbi:hypothetical protein DPMN_045055 [Dreissena polymorpha]|uniref:Uncharacterized protein n=1 Tax=Dreissena polymorpha TaxID=45954 RepID=A0A9D4D447_DREPO|nr:hypothetical protein DPMN_045055 [Dreissena polymorpha]
MIESDPSSESIRVYYSILECDDDGRTPDHSHFNPESKSCLQIIANQENKASRTL